MNKQELHKFVYGELTKEEAKLLYQGKGNYKGWRCPEIGDGLVIMRKNGNEFKAFSGASPEEWVKECWIELKQKIDEAESK
ncbi:hypothetical protein BC351_00740 [Paenibacillus ferrarius]|uniref:Uncharacterized protein n=1 Tax=Paenibacillus ferrarius TaxID=1469647 RepID=A0A1V4HSA3_9BACL|nr:hypothetical protein [Paenibacillus ferrarius]OPH61800.1 hypothetical protein BC351_00740 [Paenibacillus ferrarius]